MERVLEGIKKILEVFCCLILSVMSVIVFMQVVNRNFFDQSFVWVEELAGLCMVGITFIGASLATCTNQHTRIDFLVLKLPKRGSIIVYIIGNLICCAFAAFLALNAYPLILKNWASLTPRLKLPYGINYVSVFCGSVLMVVYYLATIIGQVKEYIATPKGTKNNQNESMEREAEEALNQ